MLNKATKMDRQLNFFKVAKFRQICFNSWEGSKEEGLGPTYYENLYCRYRHFIASYMAVG